MRTIPFTERMLTNWDKRLGVRLQRRLWVAAKDLDNAMRWHVLGGQRFFNDYWRDVAGSHRWVFVIGCNNSGTSLLQRLLEWTGEISTFAAEGQRYTRAIRRDNKNRHARVWTEYVDELQLARGDSLEPAARLVHDWMTNMPRPLKPVLVEKTPANTSRAEWLQEVFPNSCFIGLVRNGYAVTEGIRRKARQPLEAGARHWNAVNQMLLRTSANLGEYLEVRYEDLADQPAEALHRIAGFVGMDRGAVERLLGRGEVATRDAVARVFGRVRNRNSESFSRLSEDDIAEIDAHAAEMLDHFGYSTWADNAQPVQEVRACASPI